MRRSQFAKGAKMLVHSASVQTKMFSRAIRSKAAPAFAALAIGGGYVVSCDATSTQVRHMIVDRLTS